MKQHANLNELKNASKSEITTCNSGLFLPRRLLLCICAGSVLGACTKESEPVLLELLIEADTCTFRGQKYTDSELLHVLKALPRPVELTLKPASGVHYRRVASVMKILQSEGISLGSIGNEIFDK